LHAAAAALKLPRWRNSISAVKFQRLFRTFMEQSMDPITTAILAALPVIASDLIKSSIKDAYAALRAVIQQQWGKSSPIVKAVDALEASPKSKGQALVLAENVADSNATANADVMHALAKLVDELKKEGIGGNGIAALTINITGGSAQGIIGAGNVSIGTIKYGNQPRGIKR
jgi:hypothetical protein